MAPDRKPRPQGDTWYIDEDERLQIRARMKDRTPPMKQAELADLCNVTPAAITLLLSKPILRGETRGCKFLPALQKALDLANTTKKKPAIINKAALRRAEIVIQALGDGSDEALETWLKSGELHARKR